MDYNLAYVLSWQRAPLSLRIRRYEDQLCTYSELTLYTRLVVRREAVRFSSPLTPASLILFHGFGAYPHAGSLRVGSLVHQLLTTIIDAGEEETPAVK